MAVATPLDLSQPVHLPDVIVTLSDEHEETCRQVFDVCKRSLPGWTELSIDDVEVSGVECFRHGGRVR